MCEQNGTDTHKCPDCNCDMVKTLNNDPLVPEKTEYKCRGCGNEHTIHQ